MQTTFTIPEIQKYLDAQDSMGDIHYNLSAENIIEANAPTEEEQEELSECCTASIKFGLCTNCSEHV